MFHTKLLDRALKAKLNGHQIPLWVACDHIVQEDNRSEVIFNTQWKWQVFGYR
jgi:hypothetical protein